MWKAWWVPMAEQLHPSLTSPHSDLDVARGTVLAWLQHAEQRGAGLQGSGLGPYVH